MNYLKEWQNWEGLCDGFYMGDFSGTHYLVILIFVIFAFYSTGEINWSIALCMVTALKTVLCLSYSFHELYLPRHMSTDIGVIGLFSNLYW